MEMKFGILEIEEIMMMTDSKTNIPVIDDILADDKFVKIPLKELYSINELEYDNKALEELDLSTRIMNRLQGVLGIHKINEMLNLTYSQLADLKGFGKNSIVGIDDALRALSQKTFVFDKDEKKRCFSPTSKFLLRSHLSEICHGNFDILNKNSFTDGEQLLFKDMKEAVELIDEKLIMTTIKETEHIFPILDMLNSVC